MGDSVEFYKAPLIPVFRKWADFGSWSKFKQLQHLEKADYSEICEQLLDHSSKHRLVDIIEILTAESDYSNIWKGID